MDKRKAGIFSALLSLSLFSQSLPALACAFGSETIFSYRIHPPFPFTKFAAGDIGIVNHHYARSYLVVAYRYWSGKPLSKDEQQAAVAVWKQRLMDNTDGCDSDSSAWLKARQSVQGTKKIDEIDTQKLTAIDPDDAWDFFCNCKTDAFETAAKTLQRYVTKFGATSVAVKDWLQAQDTVFTNCGKIEFGKNSPTKIPTTLPDSADMEAKQDRAYQIAAAHFYSMQYPEARKEFEAIAADATSPWKTISAYLAVRTMVRQATLVKDLNVQLLNEALQKVKELSTDPNYSSFANSLSDLTDFIMARVAPEQHLKDLSARLQDKITHQNLSEYTKTIDMILHDSDSGEVDLSYEKLPDSVKADDLTDWIMVFQGSANPGSAGVLPGTTHAIAKYNETKSVPWMLAARGAVPIEQLPKTSPAYWQAFYEQNQLDIAKGKTDAVRSRLDAALLTPGLSLSTKNALKTQRLRLAQNLSELVKFGIQKPECNCGTDAIPELPDDNNDPTVNSTSQESPVWTQEAGYILDTQLPLSMLRQLASDKTIPTDLRQRLAWTSFVRAVLAGNETEAKALALILKSLNKQKAPLLNAYLAATTPGARQFAAVFLMLQFSSAMPDPGWGPLPSDDYGDDSGWWWNDLTNGNYNVEELVKIQPQFVTAAQRTQLNTELKKSEVGVAPNYFAKTVLAWAKQHPTDPRVPQALHLAVKSTRYGATNNETTVFSKKLFQLLHTKYKHSPWAKETPYYY